jgi:hypothetical protein
MLKMHGNKQITKAPTSRGDINSINQPLSDNQTMARHYDGHLSPTF